MDPFHPAMNRPQSHSTLPPPQMTNLASYPAMGRPFDLTLPPIHHSRAVRQALPSQSTLNGFPSLSLLPEGASGQSTQTSQIGGRYCSSLASMVASHPPLVGSLPEDPVTYSDHISSIVVAHPASVHPSVLNSCRSRSASKLGLPGRGIQTQMLQRRPSLLRKQSVTTLILTIGP